MIKEALGDTVDRVMYERYFERRIARPIISTKKPKSHRDLNYNNGAD